MNVVHIVWRVLCVVTHQDVTCVCGVASFVAIERENVPAKQFKGFRHGMRTRKELKKSLWHLLEGPLHFLGVWAWANAGEPL